MNPLAAVVTTVAMIATAATMQPSYPLDQELESSFAGRCSVKMVCKVTKVGDVYVYMYSIKNTSNKPVKVRWDTISQAMYFGHNMELMLELEPDENAVFTLEHPDPPVHTAGRVTAFYLTTNEKVANLVKRTPEIPKGMKIEISKKAIYNSESGSGHGALPKSFVYPGRVR